MNDIGIPRAGATLLKTALLANAIFSAGYGVLHLVFPGLLADFSGISSPIAQTAAAGTAGLLLSGYLIWLRERSALSYTSVRVIIGVDAMMAFTGLGAVIMRDSIGLTITGAWFVFAVAGAFALLAMWQYLGLRRFVAEQRTVMKQSAAVAGPR